MDLKQISRPVAAEIEEFTKVYRSQIDSKVMLLETIVRYMTRRTGKRVRPMLVLLSAAACGKAGHRSYVGATMVELLHTAALVHDDVVDQASERRGIASINAVWKNKVSVLLGDYLLARGLLAAVDAGEFRFLQITSRAVQRMSEGELLQIQKSKLLDIDEETYFKIIGDKTASLIACSCEIGAVSATEDEQVQANLRDYGELIGCAFQIRDDIFDYLGSGFTIGKPVGNDLKQKKLTLPLIHSFANAPRSESKAIMKIVKGKPTRDDVKRVARFVMDRGGIDYAQKRAQDLVDEAKSKLAGLPMSDARAALEAFAEFTIERSA